jgi:hypothetical protein
VERRIHVQFIAAASHGTRTLEWVGASLAPLVYPGHSSYLLRELWSSLIADVNRSLDVNILLQPTRVEVFIEAGILRPADCTPERIGHMISVLEERMAEPWCGRYNMEVHLPEPARCMTEDEAAADDTDYEERPAKRRRGSWPPERNASFAWNCWRATTSSHGRGAASPMSSMPRA